MTEALIERYDGLVCDLDGVVYAGPSAVPHAIDSLEQVMGTGRSIVYATNNASRPGVAVSEHLTSLGLTARAEDIINSSVAGAHVLELHRGGPKVLAVGGRGVDLALREAGFTPVSPREVRDGASVDSVLQGYGADVTAADLAEAAYAVQGGALWVATNTDETLPTDRGRAPGNGSLVGAVRYAVDHDPLVAGKPEPVMYELASDRMNLARRRVLAIGDRLETDVQGAVAGGFDSVLVLTGVHGWADAAAAGEDRRPTYVLDDLRGLFEPYVVQDVATEEEFHRATSTAQLRGALSFAWRQMDEGAWTADQAQEKVRSICGGLPQ